MNEMDTRIVDKDIDDGTQVQVLMDVYLDSYYLKNKSLYGLSLPHSFQKIIL